MCQKHIVEKRNYNIYVAILKNKELIYVFNSLKNNRIVPKTAVYSYRYERIEHAKGMHQANFQTIDGRIFCAPVSSYRSIMWQRCRSHSISPDRLFVLRGQERTQRTSLFRHHWGYSSGRDYSFKWDLRVGRRGVYRVLDVR